MKPTQRPRKTGENQRGWAHAWAQRDRLAFDADPAQWIKQLAVDSTKDVQVPTSLIDQVIGQDQAVAIARKAAEQRRHVLLIGDPGTGKSMLAKAMAEILPTEAQNDLLALHNPKTPNCPRVIGAPGGSGPEGIHDLEHRARRKVRLWRIGEGVIAAIALAFGAYLYFLQGESLLSFLFIAMLAMFFLYFTAQHRPKAELIVPRLLISRSDKPQQAPYVDATGSQAGALLGDVRHDPFQSGGLETPPHARVEVGAIHRAHRGVLFVDEINVLRLASQQALLTAMQDGQYAISGQGQQSAGAMVRTEPVPCDFILVAAGNLDAMMPAAIGHDVGLHPALRSRIRGYGYEVYVNNVMDDSNTARLKLMQFVAQEVERDGRIPHFDRAAIAEVIREAQRRAGQTGKLTLRLRELGGLVRTAGDFARTENAGLVTPAHVRLARKASQSLEQQIAQAEIKRKLRTTASTGAIVGTAKGAAVVGTGEVGEPAGLVVPVEAALVPALSRTGGAIIVGGGLRERHGTNVETVGALLKSLKGQDIASFDLHVDATIAHPDAHAEGIALAVAIAAVSALEGTPVRQDTVLIGDLSISGELRPVDAILQRLEAAMQVGITKAILPAASQGSLLLDEQVCQQMSLQFCHRLTQVLPLVLDGSTDVAETPHNGHVVAAPLRRRSRA